MKRATIALLAAALCLLWAAPAQAEFGLNDFDVFFEEADGTAATQAGSHPYAMRVSFGINFSGVGEEAQPDGEVKDLDVEQIAGLLGDPAATPRCAAAEFFAFRAGKEGNECPNDAALGVVLVNANKPENEFRAPVYNLAPPPGSILRLGFAVLRVPVVIDIGLKSAPDHNPLALLRNVRQVLKVYGAELTLWGVPADESHDTERGHCAEEGGTCPTAIAERPFLTLPGSCRGPQRTSYEALSWQGERDSGFSLSHDASGAPQGFTECGGLAFEPAISSRPTTGDAESASGLAFEIDFDQAGLTDRDGRAQSQIKEAEVTLPRGVTANPSIAAGLGTCSRSDLARETLGSGPGEGCPSASKVGSVEVETPLLEQSVGGTVYVATPEDPDTASSENPFGSLIALYIVIKHPGLGILVKLPAEVTPDSEGRLTTTVTDIPQVPFSHFSFRFREGRRAPLITPPACGAYLTEARFVPWSDPSRTQAETASFRISAGVGGGPCPPAGPAPFAPGFAAGSLSNAAGHFSPFALRLTRRDGEQDMSRLAATLPPGVTGRLAGLARCPEARIALARQKSAGAELASPSCPAASRIGSTLAGAGVGEALTYVPGSLYLAGPLGGAPLSVVAITPAKAGPFDAGTVVVRTALRVDPRSAQVRVDGAASDPIPHILKGIPLKLRDLRVVADRPAFTLNPTSCDPAATRAILSGAGTHLDPRPDFPVALFAPYQAAACQRLGFKPRLALRLRGRTRRGAFPALRAVYRPRPGHANLRRLALRFPRSAFIEQAHFRTICTRVQYAANACPKGSIYGRARAFTPLLDQPLEGPVYLRSSDNNLPDAVFALKGLIDVEAVVRIDSVRGGLRATVVGAPDAPVSRVVVNMRGGRKGLFVNSRGLCRHKNRATANFTAHSAERLRLRPVVRPAGCKASKKRRGGKRARRR